MGTGQQMAIVYNEWIDHPEVGADEIVVLTVLALHADANGRCWPSQQTIADRIGDRSRQWVNRVLKKLAELGLVQKIRRKRDDKGDRSCLYTLAVPARAERSAADGASAPSTPRMEAEAAVDGSVSSVAAAGTGCHRGRQGTPESEQIHNAPSAGAHEDRSSSALAVLPQVPAEDWQPSDQALLWAMDRYPQMDIAAHAERFVLKARAKGYRFADVEAGWKSWLMADAGQGGGGEGVSSRGGSAAAPPRMPASYVRYAAWAGVARNAA